MNNYNMRVGLNFFSKIGEVLIYLRIFFLNHFSEVSNFTNI